MNALGGGGGANLPTGALHHYDFSDDANLTLSGSEITAVADLGTTGSSLAPRTAGERPTNTGTINSVQAADFDGADSLFGTLNSYFGGSDQPFTVAIVAQDDVASGAADLVAFNSSGSANPYYDFRSQTGTGGFNFGKRDTSGTLKTATGGTPNTSPHVFLYWSNGTTVSLEVDGVSIFSGTDINVVGSTGVNRLSLGVWYQVSSLFNYLNGKIGEVVIYGTELSSGDRTDLKSFLNAKWGF